MKGGSLCTGGGGLDLGLARVLDIEWAWHCESDGDAAAVLDHHYPGVPNHGDLVNFDWKTAEPVDLVAAGFPCPDYSLAGNRTGIEGDHGQVWFGVAAALRTLRPRYIILENVPGIRTAAGVRRDAGERALGVVLADLAALGYRWAYDGLRAADVGAPHGRDRWFCVARLASESAGVGVDADRRVRGGGAGVSGSGRSAASSLSAGAQVVFAADAVADYPSACEGLGGGGVDADAGGMARAEAGELAARPREGGESSARGEARAEVDRTPGRARRGGGSSLADADDAGRGEHGGAVTAEEELGAAERGRSGHGGGEAPPDAAGGGRGRWSAREGCDVARRETAVGAKGDAATGDGGGDARGVDRASVLGGADGAAAASADTSSERGEPRCGRRAAGSTDARRGTPKRDRDGHMGEAEPGQIEWGVYEAAIRRWEENLGRSAPPPTDERGRLSPPFVEWMLGYPDGWVSSIDIPRTAQLRILGNSVQVQCAEQVGGWLERLTAGGIL